MECPYESNPPAQYEWTRVPSCGSIGEPLSWPQNTTFFNNNKTLRLDGRVFYQYIMDITTVLLLMHLGLDGFVFGEKLMVGVSLLYLLLIKFTIHSHV